MKKYEENEIKLNALLDMQIYHKHINHPILTVQDILDISHLNHKHELWTDDQKLLDNLYKKFFGEFDAKSL